MKTFVTLFYIGLKNIHLTKDVGLIPYYMHKHFSYNSTIITPAQKGETYEDIEKYTKGLEIKQIAGMKIGFINFGLIGYLIKNAKKIDTLHMFHFSVPTLLYGLIYKLFHRKGTLYLKMDFDIQQFKNKGNKIYDFGSKMANKLSKPFENLLIKICNIISVEVEDGVNLLNTYNIQFKKKLIWLPNGADNINIDRTITNIKTPKEKENLIITIGRIGTLQKNTEMLLAVLQNIDLQDRKVKIIGTIEQDFMTTIDKLFNEMPHLQNTIEFTGPKDKKEVYEYYNKAKIFVLTSRWEGFPIVYPEAIYFGNHIITTDVSGAQDITHQEKIGDIVDIGDTKKFTAILQKYIQQKDLLEDGFKDIKEYSTKKFTRSNIIEKLQHKLLFTNKK